jgi:hypothetical protein
LDEKRNKQTINTNKKCETNIHNTDIFLMELSRDVEHVMLAISDAITVS